MTDERILKIRRAAVEAGVTISAVADAIGMSRNYLRQMMCGACRLSDETFSRAMTFLGDKKPIRQEFVVRQTFNGRHTFLSEAHYDLFLFRADSPEQAKHFRSRGEAEHIANWAAKIYPLCSFEAVLISKDKEDKNDERS